MQNRADARRRRPAAMVPSGVAVGLLVASVIVAGCSKVTGSKSSTSGRPVACTFIAKLDNIADTVARADVHDPDAFNETLQQAVRDYVSNVRQLRAIAPADLTSSLEHVEADVQQLRFDAAVADRAPLDLYAARSCGRIAAGATSSVPGASTATSSRPASPAPTATAPTGPTTSTTAAGG